MIPSAKSAIRDRPPPLNSVQQAEDVAAAELLLDVVDRLDVDARDRDVRAEAVEREQQRREGELLADLRDREGAEDRATASARRGLAASIDAGAVPPAASIASRARPR